jgi:hypothetical protein
MPEVQQQGSGTAVKELHSEGLAHMAACMNQERQAGVPTISFYFQK